MAGLRWLVVLGIVAATASATAEELIPLGCIVSPDCWASSSASRPELLSTPGRVVDVPDELGAPAAPETLATSAALGGDEELQKTLIEARSFADAVAKLDPFGAELARLQKNEFEETKGVIGEWPEEFGKRYDHYLTLLRTRNCSADVTALAAISAIWADVSALAVGRTTSEKDRQILAVATYRLYLDDCFDRFETAPDFIDRVVLLGRVYAPSRFMPFCAGFLLKDNLVVTARHCAADGAAIEMFKEDYGLDDLTTQIKINKPVPGTRAILLGDPTKVYLLALPGDASVDYNPNVPEFDTITLALRDFDKPVEAYPRIADPKQWMNLELLGIHEVVIDLQKVTSWRDLTTLVDRSEICTAFFVDPPCIFHSCQSRLGLSGSPLFARTDAGTTFIGVHTGSVGIERPACDFKRKYSFPNLGLDLSEILPNGGVQ